jgi:hypothetical protein
MNDFIDEHLDSYLLEEAFLNPSDNITDSWLHAQCLLRKKHKNPTKNTGKWLIFRPESKIDKAWEIIEEAVENGSLWKYAKVSTKFSQKPNSDSYVICVYTYNWEDEKDVLQIREKLKELGFNETLYYKTDEDTRKGIYGDKEKRVAKYTI